MAQHPRLRAPAVALLLLATPARAAASLGDEPLLDPKLELDPRVSFDPRVDTPDPPRGPRAAPAKIHTPIWISIGASYGTVAKGLPLFGAQLQVGLPLDRLAARDVRRAVVEIPSASPGCASDAARPWRCEGTSADGPARPTSAALAEGPNGRTPPAAPPSPRHKLDLAPPPPPPKLTLPVAPTPEPPLPLPVVVTSAAAHAAVEAALHHARLADPEVRIDALVARARQSAGLPELRLRVLRTADDGQTLSPVSYDPTRIVAVDTIRFWLEARATWRLDRLLFAEEEVTLERMRHDRAEAQAKLTKEVLKLLFEWQRARAAVDNPLLSPEDNLSARLKVIETSAELDVLTEGWFARWRQASGDAAATDAPAPP